MTNKHKDTSSSKRRKISLLQPNIRNTTNKSNQTKVEKSTSEGKETKTEGNNKSLLVDKTNRNSIYTHIISDEFKKRSSEDLGVTKKKSEESSMDTAKSYSSEEVLTEISNTGSSEGLGNLLSVAEAFERSQKPDFNDVLNPILRGTDTEKVLVRSCVICKKQLLGRNAYGRHMKNVHSKIFGPYPCPECFKEFESGYLLMQHMYIHLGPRGKAAGKKG